MNDKAREEIRQLLCSIGGEGAYQSEIKQIDEILRHSYIPKHGNLIQANQSKLPRYKESLVRKVGRQKIKFTPEQKASAREVLRKLGLL